MKTWAKSWQTPWPRAKASTALVPVLVASISKRMRSRIAVHQGMHQAEPVAAGASGDVAGEIADQRIGGGECGVAQIKHGRKALHLTAEHAGGVDGLDAALGDDGQLAIGPSSVNSCIRLPKASLDGSRRQSRSMSMRQAAMYCPLWPRGSRRSTSIARLAGVA